MKLIGLIEEREAGYLKPNNCLSGATCKICKRKVGNENISYEDESCKTAFNAKNTSLACEFYRTLKAAHCDFGICSECVVVLSTKNKQKKKEQ